MTASEEFRKPDMLILRAQINLGRGGSFEITSFVDGLETEMLTEDEEVPQERMTFVQDRLNQCNPEGIQLLKEILIRQSMEQHEINSLWSGVRDGYNLFASLYSRTSFLDIGERQKVWVKPVFIPILEKLLFEQTAKPRQSS